MANGFLGDIDRERRIVAWLYVGGLLLILAGLDALNVFECRGTGDFEDGITQCADSANDTIFGWIFLIGAICLIAGQALIMFSVLRTTGENGEWLWFAFSLTGGAAPIYYFLDWIGSPLVEGVE